MKREDGSVEISLPDAKGKKVAIVAAQFYAALTDQLVDGARRAAIACGVAEKDIIEIRVPGCFELPIGVQRIMRRDDPDAVIALGVVVRGETPHFDYVAGECARGLMTLQLTSGVPVGFGVLTTETLEQAQERADPARGDKGYEAGIAALTIAAISSEKKEITIGFRR